MNVRNNPSNSFYNTKNSFGVGENKNDYEFKNIPSGLMSAFTQNPAAMTVFENMDDDTKRKVIEKASHVSSKKEMMKLVQDISINNL